MMMWARGPSRPARPDNEFVVQEFRSSGVQEFRSLWARGPSRPARSDNEFAETPGRWT